MSSKTTNTTYRRYTDLPSLIQILTTGKLTLLDPATWDDKNDSFFLSIYKEKRQLETVLALCFTTASETYHHWRVFSDGPSGVCIHFKSTHLEAAMHNKRIQFKKVSYLKVDELRKNKPRVAQLPFIKRFPFRAEEEFRALWESKSDKCNFLEVPIELSSIARITLSPWLHPNLRKNTVSAIKRIPDCKSIPIWRSTLTGNSDWQNYGKKAT
jgi:hypothetical protein